MSFRVLIRVPGLGGHGLVNSKLDIDTGDGLRLILVAILESL